MKKRMLSLICVLALCLGLLPVTALAVDASDFDCGFLTLGDIVGRWEGEGAELQPGSRATLRRTASSMAKEEL